MALAYRVMGPRPHFVRGPTGQLRGRDNVDSGNRHHANIRSLRQVAGKFSLQGVDSPLKMLIKLLQVGPNRMMERPVLDAVSGRLRCPSQDFVNRAVEVADLVLAEMLAEAALTKLDHLGGRVTAARNDHRGLVVEQVIKQSCETGHGQVQVFANLAGEGGRILDQVAAMPRSELQFSIRGFQLQLAKPESGYGSSMLSKQIGLVGFVARIGWHPILFGGERMHDACFQASTGESPLGRQMVISGSFHDDDGVLNVVLLLGLANQLHGHFQ